MPTILDLPPKLTRCPSTSEPPDVTILFDKLNGHRTNDYTEKECNEIDQLIQNIANENKGDFDWELLPGTWILVYLQPGPY